MQRKIKIESEVPCIFSETGAHKVTMLFTKQVDDEGEDDGLQLVHLSCECGEDAAEISEVLDEGTECCGLVRDDVRLAASGEDPRTHDPIIANALKQIKSGNAKTHRMRAARRKPVEPVMKLERDANRALPAGFEFRLERWGGKPVAAAIVKVRHRRSDTDAVIASYIGRGTWKMDECYHREVHAAAEDKGTQLKIKYKESWRRRSAMESVSCLTCGVSLNPASRMSHLKSTRHLNRVNARLNDAMMLVSERLGRRWL